MEGGRLGEELNQDRQNEKYAHDSIAAIESLSGVEMMGIAQKMHAGMGIRHYALTGNNGANLRDLYAEAAVFFAR